MIMDVAEAVGLSPHRRSFGKCFATDMFETFGAGLTCGDCFQNHGWERQSRTTKGSRRPRRGLTVEASFSGIQHLETSLIL